MQIPTEVTEALLALSSALLLALVSWVSAAIRSKVKNEDSRGVMLHLSNAVENAVRAVGQELTNQIRVVSSDGKITPEEAAELRGKAFEYVKLYLGEATTKELQRIVGQDKLSELVFSMVEAQLHTLKQGTL